MRDLVVIVTGSTRGIGLALAKACTARGARVVVHGRDPARVAAIAAELGAIGVATELPPGAEAIVRAALEAFGRVDVLVNNAAMSPARAPLWEHDAAALDATIATNLAAPMQLARALLAWSVPRSHPVRIVNVSSGATSAVPHDAAAYVASKAGLDGLTRALAAEIATRPEVVVTGVALGAVQIGMSAIANPGNAAVSVEAAVGQLVDAIVAGAQIVHGRVLAPRPSGPRLDTEHADLLAIAPSPRARAALASAAIERYPREPRELRAVLAARFGVTPEAIVVGGGISELLDRVARVTLRPGETAIANVPAWPLVPRVFPACHGVPYRISGDRADHDLDSIAGAIDRTVRVVYLTSPANPTGQALDARAFERFVDRVPRHVTVVVDEAYAEFAPEPAAITALVRWTDKRVVVLRSFSKLHGLAGLRIGYAVTTIGRELADAAPPFPITRGAEEAALAALADAAHVRRVLAAVASARARVERDLDARGIHRLASDAPFLLAADPGAPGPRFFAGNYVMMPLTP
jgi:histidinol-phosphate aminotransferase